MNKKDMNPQRKTMEEETTADQRCQQNLTWCWKRQMPLKAKDLEEAVIGWPQLPHPQTQQITGPPRRDYWTGGTGRTRITAQGGGEAPI